jgi:scyllo-inositol 2-dehydrogenase (NADP+)
MKRYKKAQDITVGVIGYGGAFNMGRHHLLEMQKAGMTPKAVSEIDTTRLAAAQQEFPGIETYASVEAMVKQSSVDLVTIITPHNTHADIAVKCLKGGKHVVCEKPFAITTAECDRMIAAAKAKKLVLSTYHNRHWDGNVLQALKVVRSGAIGDVIRVEAHMGSYGKPDDWWRSSKSISGGVLYDWGAHLLEYALQIIASDVVEVSGFAKNGYWAPQTKWKKDTNEDEAFGVVRFSSGAWLTLCITSIDSHPKQGVLEVTGTKGSFVCDHRTWETITHDGDNTVVTKGNNPENEWWRYYKNVADHLLSGENLVITPEWARRPIHVLDLIDQSARKGSTLKAKYR